MQNDQYALWGFHPLQEAFYLALLETCESLRPARVVFASHGHFKIRVLGESEERKAKFKGSQNYQGENQAVVGDWVVVQVRSGDHEYLPIAQLLPRKSELRRSDSRASDQTMVSNVDKICLVTSFNQDYNERRIERGLAMIQEGNIEPLLVLNKSDLVAESEAENWVKKAKVRFGDIAIICCSAQNQASILQLTKRFKVGETIGFLGMSGVGKSTIINELLGQKKFSTKEIRLADSRGGHTTTHRELVQTTSGFWLLDSPGIREFSYAGGEETLGDVFRDIDELQQKCRFGDCRHDSEPGCAIKEALLTNELQADRWLNYRKLLGETRRQVSKQQKQKNRGDRKAALEKKRDLQNDALREFQNRELRNTKMRGQR